MNALPRQDDADPSKQPAMRCRAHKFGGSSLADAGRIRDVEVAADGAVLVLTDAGDGALLRLTPERTTN